MDKEFITYINDAERISAINKELEQLEEKLKTPQRTVADIVRHMQLLKELRGI